MSESDDEIEAAIREGDPIKALGLALKACGARVTFDRQASWRLPCYGCGSSSAPRTLEEVGRWTRPRIGGSCQVGDAIRRPLCRECLEISEPPTSDPHDTTPITGG